MQLLQLKEIEVAMKSYASVVNVNKKYHWKKGVHYLETEAFIIYIKYYLSWFLFEVDWPPPYLQTGD